MHIPWLPFCTSMQSENDKSMINFLWKSLTIFSCLSTVISKWQFCSILPRFVTLTLFWLYVVVFVTWFMVKIYLEINWRTTQEVTLSLPSTLSYMLVYIWLREGFHLNNWYLGETFPKPRNPLGNLGIKFIGEFFTFPSPPEFSNVFFFLNSMYFKISKTVVNRKDKIFVFILYMRYI